MYLENEKKYIAIFLNVEDLSVEVRKNVFLLVSDQMVWYSLFSRRRRFLRMAGKLLIVNRRMEWFELIIRRESRDTCEYMTQNRAKENQTTYARWIHLLLSVFTFRSGTREVRVKDKYGLYISLPSITESS